MKKLFLFVFACILSVSTCYAANSNLIEENLPTNDLYEKTAEGPIEVDEVVPYEPVSLLAADDEIPAWLGNGFLPYYNYFAGVENADLYQQLYQTIYLCLYNYGYNYGGKVLEYNGEYFMCIDMRGYSSLEWEEMFDVTFAVCEDNPQFYYVSGSLKGLSANGIPYLSIGISDLYIDGDVRCEQNSEITKAIDEYDEIIDISWSNYKIEKAVHDKLILDNNYAYDSNGVPSEEHYAHSIVGCLDSDYPGGVCESYAKSFQMLMNYYGVPCYYATGLANGGGHAWNVVQLDDGEFYCVDLTWDDPVYTNSDEHCLRYVYFNMPYSMFYNGNNNIRDNSYMVDERVLPALSENKTYYSTSPDTVVGKAENGDHLYQAPVVPEQSEAREPETVTYFTENSTEATTGIYIETTEAETEDTTCSLQPVAKNSINQIKMINDTGNWGWYEPYQFIYCFGSGKTSFVSYDEGVLTLDIYNPDGIVYITIDEVLVGTVSADSQYRYSWVINLPAGVHKVNFDFVGNASDAQCSLYDISVISLGDINADGEVTLIDAVALKAMDSYTSEYLGSRITDLNADKRVDDKDVALILKKVCRIPD